MHKGVGSAVTDSHSGLFITGHRGRVSNAVGCVTRAFEGAKPNRVVSVDWGEWQKPDVGWTCP